MVSTTRIEVTPSARAEVLHQPRPPARRARPRSGIHLESAAITGPADAYHRDRHLELRQTLRDQVAGFLQAFLGNLLDIGRGGFQQGEVRRGGSPRCARAPA
ncbi:hypothetical protein ACU4GD_38905 [Cupriavidus basilensis]